MNNKKNLLSVLLVAVLLVATVCGVLIFGANAETGTETIVLVREADGGTASAPYFDETAQKNVFKDTYEATAWAKANVTFEPGDSLRIEIDQATFSLLKKSNYMFATSATGVIEDTEYNNVPITVTKSANQASVTLNYDSAGNSMFLNHYVVEGIAFNIAQYATGYVSDYLEFKDCTLTAATTSTFYASMNTSGGYKLTEDNFNNKVIDGELIPEIVLSGSTTSDANIEFSCYRNHANGDSYWPADGYVVAGQYQLHKSKVGGKIVVQDSANISGEIVGVSGSHFGPAYIEINGGTVNKVTGVGTTTVNGTNANGTLASTDTVSILINGGTVRNRVTGATTGTNAGTINIELRSGLVNSEDTSNDNEGLQCIEGGTLTGTVNIDVTGGTVTGCIAMASGGGTVDNGAVMDVDVTGGKITEYIAGVYSGGSAYSSVNAGAIFNIDVTGVTSGQSHGYVTFAHSKWPAMTFVDGIDVNITVGGTAKVSDVFGGYTTSGSKAMTINSPIDIDITGGDVTGIVAAAYTGSTTAGGQTILTNGATIDVTGGTVGTLTAAMYGGYLNGTEPVKITVSGGTVTNVIGLRRFTAASINAATADFNQNVEIKMTGGTVTGCVYGVYGQNKGEADVKANIDISITGGTIDGGSAKFYYYATASYGTYYGSVVGVANARLTGDVTISIDASESGKTITLGKYVAAVANENGSLAADTYARIVGDFSLTVNGGENNVVENEGVYSNAKITCLAYYLNAVHSDNLTFTAKNMAFAEDEVFHSIMLSSLDGATYGNIVSNYENCHIDSGNQAGFMVKNRASNRRYVSPVMESITSTYKDVTVTSNIHGVVPTEYYTDDVYPVIVNGDVTTNFEGAISIGSLYRDVGMRNATISGKVITNVTDATFTTSGQTQIGTVECGATGYEFNVVNSQVKGGGTLSVSRATVVKFDATSSCAKGTSLGANASLIIGEEGKANTGTYASVSGTGAVTINNGTYTFNGAITGTTVTLHGGTYYLESNANIAATSTSGDITIARKAGLYKDDATLLTIPEAYAANIILDNSHVRGYAYKETAEGTCSVLSKLPNNFSASLVITNRVAIKFIFDKAETEHAMANAGKALTYSFDTPDGQVTGTLTQADYNAEKGRYEIVLPAVGAKDFDANFTFMGACHNGKQFTINSIATAGAEMEGVAPEVAQLFKALIDYGAAAEGTLEAQTAGVVIDTTDIPANLGATGVQGVFTNKTLLMGDAIGIRLFANGDTSGLTVKLYDEDVTAKTVRENNCVDIYINALRMNDVLEITIYDGEDLVLTLRDTVKNIANQLVELQPNNLKAQSTLALIQATQNYAALLG